MAKKLNLINFPISFYNSLLNDLIANLRIKEFDYIFGEMASLKKDKYTICIIMKYYEIKGDLKGFLNFLTLIDE